MRWIAVLAFLAVISCTAKSKHSPIEFDAQKSVSLRPLKTSEALEDFDQLAGFYRSYYGPLEYKESRFNFQFEQLVAEARKSLLTAKTDPEIFSIFAKFVGNFKDGHTGIDFPMNSSGILAFKIPVFLMPVENTVLAAFVDESLKDSGIEVGDEVLSVDGIAPLDYLPTVLQYPTIGNEVSDRHLVYRAFNRPAHMVEIAPKKPFASVTLKKPDGRITHIELPWRGSASPDADTIIAGMSAEKYSLTYPGKSDYNSLLSGSLLQMGSVSPFFLSAQVKAKFKLRQVFASEAFRKKWGLADNEKPDIFAALYRHQGKNILLVRSYTYSHSDFSNAVYMKGYAAIMDEWQDLADVVVLDQTHNGGGSYCAEFFRYFIDKEEDGSIQFLNSDRKWIQVFNNAAADSKTTDNERISLKAFSALVEKAYDAGLSLTEAIPLFSDSNRVLPIENFKMRKPVLVLIDEVAGSCADMFPMLIKNAGVAKLFGQRTMGLGGNVESFGPLVNSRANVRLTRGLFTSYRADQAYTSDMMIENNGVQPDYPYTHTVQDFRDGFVKYVETFSDRAVEQIPAP